MKQKMNLYKIKTIYKKNNCQQMTPRNKNYQKTKTE